MQSIDFYQRHLDRVSRSFAFCIKKLEGPLRLRVSMAYLLCRVLDTVEDALWNDTNLQQKQFREFESYLCKGPSSSQVEAWVQRFPKGVTEGEQALLLESFFLFHDFHELPSAVQSSMRTTILKMSEGMGHYANRPIQNSDTTNPEILKLSDLNDVNRYCYFVAGVVGELLTFLLQSVYPSFMQPPHFMKNAVHFGLFLQKVNLLKDQRGDEREGRFLVPHRTLMLASLRENARGAVTYITQIPLEEKGYRVFCAWSLFLGAASIPWIQKSFDADDGSKIPRSVTEELLKTVEEMSQDNKALLSALEEFLPSLPEWEGALVKARATVNKDHESSKDEGRWFEALALQTLTPSDLSELRFR